MVDTLAETLELLQKLERALSEDHLEDAGRLAHTIKSAGRTFGAEKLTQQARQVEEAAIAGQRGEASRRTAELRNTVALIGRELEEKLQQTS